MRLTFFVLLLLPTVALAQNPATIVEEQIERFIAPGFEAFEAAARALDAAPCDAMEAPYHAAFDAWMRVSHLRFGPTEEEDRGFALAFWPDGRGATPRTLSNLIAQEDPVGRVPEAFAEVSVAARGFFALDWLLFDPDRTQPEPGSYTCALAETMAADIALIARDLREGWRVEATLMRTPGAENNFAYLTADEPVRALYSALVTGLTVTQNQRLDRPLGTFERPRPRRAEAWRSGRSARNVALSVSALAEYAEPFLSALAQDVATSIRADFERVEARLAALDDPTFSGVANPLGRVRVEAIRSALRAIEGRLAAEVAPTLGISQSFNALDGD